MRPNIVVGKRVRISVWGCIDSECGCKAANVGGAIECTRIVEGMIVRVTRRDGPCAMLTAQFDNGALVHLGERTLFRVEELGA